MSGATIAVLVGAYVAGVALVALFLRGANTGQWDEEDSGR